MRKRIGIVLILAIMAGSITGCAQLRDKFVRKSKEEEKPVRQYYAVREYDVHPNMDLYTKRYIFWKTWHKELLDVLDSDNSKKIKVAAEQELSNLIDMRNMLNDEKAGQIQEYVDELTTIEQTIRKEGITRGNKVGIRRRLELLGKNVKRDFSYNKVTGMLADEFRDSKQ